MSRTAKRILRDLRGIIAGHANATSKSTAQCAAAGTEAKKAKSFHAKQSDELDDVVDEVVAEGDGCALSDRADVDEVVEDVEDKVEEEVGAEGVERPRARWEHHGKEDFQVANLGARTKVL